MVAEWERAGARVAPNIELGTVQCGAKVKTFILEVKRAEATYRLVVEGKLVPREHSTKLYRKVARGFQDENLQSYPDILGYVLTRAISRGIGTCEIIETETTVLIDLGVMP